MTNKRKREPTKIKATKTKATKKIKKVLVDQELLAGENVFGALNSNDSDLLQDTNSEAEQDEDDIFIESDTNDETERIVKSHTVETAIQTTQLDREKDVLHKNDVAGNKDFIGFGFEFSDDDTNEFSDDGRISNDETSQFNTEISSLYPWIKAHDHLTQKEIADWLTLEIKDFVNYISPSKEEIIMRNLVVKSLQKCITECWPDAEAHVFGSYATDLYLPGSDIDMVVISQNGDCEQRHKLYQLSSFLRQHKMAKDIEVISGAKVPIIKFIEPNSNIHIDISFERTNGLVAARRIRKWLASTIGLRELVMVVKQFLRSRKLNNVHVGGLGGYSTIILCYHFLKLHPRIATKTMKIVDNLGSLLIEFFELYGRNFSYDNLIIAIDPVTDLPKYLKKRQHPSLATNKNVFTLIIQDPDESTNNITRSSYNLRDIKKAFGGAYQILTDKCYQLNAATYKWRIGQLILGDVIKFKGKERDFNDDRNLVINHALVEHEIKINQETQVVDTEPVNIEPTIELKEYFSEITVDTDEEDTVNKSVSQFISLVSSDDEPSGDEHEKVTIGKEEKRMYWQQKGLEL